ncbi:hypothetical protein PIB30_081230 [Stylosanthes scabra]|uniref:Uncharacterized protein n=1 Tax=Stylosanthes scabra TaxID=79078 RepID=A0ABU6ST77_9FABA|nr:hypothetical protein [Stylosanthes scabra]
MDVVSDIYSDFIRVLPPSWRKNVILSSDSYVVSVGDKVAVNLGEVGRKEVTRIFYRMPVAVPNTFVYRKMPLRTEQNVTMMFSYHHGISSVFAIELCVQLQDVGGSSSSSNHVDSGRGININDAVCIPPNRRASSPSPSFSLYVNRPVQEPPPEVPLFQDHAGAMAIHSSTWMTIRNGVIAMAMMMMSSFRRTTA